MEKDAHGDADLGQPDEFRPIEEAYLRSYKTICEMRPGRTPTAVGWANAIVAGEREAREMFEKELGRKADVFELAEFSKRVKGRSGSPGGRAAGAVSAQDEALTTGTPPPPHEGEFLKWCDSP